MDDHQMTLLIARMNAGDVEAREELAGLLHGPLRALARRELERQGGDSVFQPTALVNEVWLRLQESGGAFKDRQHLSAVAARAMRNLLIDCARRRRRGPGLDEEPGRVMEAVVSCFEEAGVDLDALHLALEELEERDAEATRLIELRFFMGASAAEAAAAVGLSERTAVRRVDFAKRWLRKRLEP